MVPNVQSHIPHHPCTVFIHLYLKTCPVYMQYTDGMEVDELDAVAILISKRMPSTLFARAWANRPRQHHPMTP